jgi:NADPH:quinone reductase-like Zn-dependent oxidoreductase
MKAIVLKKNGGIENLQYTETDKPAIQPGEVLVKVKAIAINPVDTFVRQQEEGLKIFLKPAPGQDTFILGWDISGDVEEVGTGVTTFKKGDAVFGMVNFRGQGKAYAEYVSAPAAHLALKPDNITYQEAAAATLAALTAWQALVTYAKIKQGDKVLIHAAAGGVGHYAVQIARYFGAYVIGTASAANKDFVLGLGADEFIDYKKERFEEKVQDADIVIDPIYGEEHVLRSLQAVKRGGRVITLLTPFEGTLVEKAREKDLYTHLLSVISNGEDEVQLAELLKTGKVKSYIAGNYPFEELPKAHEQMQSGKKGGKIVVSM